MTGVGTARGATEFGQLAIEIRTVNGRGLTVRSRFEPALQGLEPAVEQRVRARVTRGSVTIAVTRDRATEATPVDQLIDPVLAAQAHRELSRLHADLGLDGAGPSLRDLLAVPGVLASPTRVRVARELSAAAVGVVDAAIDALLLDRGREGDVLARAMLESFDALGQLRDQAAERAPLRIDDYRQRLRARVEEFLAGRAKVLRDEDLVREVALFAERADVQEELVRLEAHLDHARALLTRPEDEGDARGGSFGRRLEFLLQEMQRETNTLGSKAADIEITEVVVAMKDLIDKMKEQAANLE